MQNQRFIGRLGLALVVGFAVQAAAQENVVEVTVTGEGMSEDSARNDALRKALEQGGGVEISSHSQAENFQLIRDTIYARAEGIVSDYKILEQGDAAGGVKFCKIKAKVNKSAIATTWGEVQNVLDQVGRPGIAIYILERIDGLVQDSSILESQIENRLLKAGFNVYAGQQLRALAEKEGGDAGSEGNVAKVQAIAKDFGTQIFITGTAQANAAGVKELAGEPTAMYNGDGMIKMYYTDSAQMLASESLANWRGGARGFHTVSPQAGKKALENAGEELVERCYQSVMKQWATRISAGGELTLEVQGMSLADALKLKKKIQDISADKIKNVNHSLTKGIVTFRIKAQMTAEELAEHLAGGEFAQIIEIVDLKTNRIQAKKVGG
jgi:hypothetical protein